MRLPFVILFILMLPLFAGAQTNVPYDTSECARMNRMLSLRAMIQEETILRQQKQINLFTDAVVYGKDQKLNLFGDEYGKLRRERNIFVGSTGLLLIAFGVLVIAKK